MSRFKAGDLALIVGCDYASSNIGKCVELVMLVQSNEEYSFGGLDVINANNCPVWIVVGDVNGVAGSPGWIQKAEQNLMPLRGDFQPESERTAELEH